MTWLLLSLVVAVAYAAQGVCAKKLLQDYPDAWVRWWLFVIAAPLLALYLGVRGVPEIGPTFWPVLAIASVGGAISFWFYMRALRLTDLSLAYPLISLTPLFMIPVELVLLGDLPGALGLAGIVAVVSGVYVLNLQKGRSHVLDPFRAVLRDRGALMALALAMIWAVTGVIDKVAIGYSSPALYAPAVTTGMALLYTPAMWRERGREAHPGPVRSAHIALFALQGLFFALMYVAQLEALRFTLVSYVISIKRSGALLSVAFGWAFFAERSVGYRLLGAAVIMAGVFLLALG